MVSRTASEFSDAINKDRMKINRQMKNCLTYVHLPRGYYNKKLLFDYLASKYQADRTYRIHGIPSFS